MKRLLLIFALCLFLPRSVSAQSSSVDDFFRRYDASEGFTSVLLEQKMMQMMSRQAAQRGDKGLAVLLKDIEYIRIIALKGGDSGMLVRDAEAAVAADRKFQPVTSGTEDGQTTKFYIRETALSVKSELVMITYGRGEHLRRVRPQAGGAAFVDPPAIKAGASPAPFYSPPGSFRYPSSS